jgi:uncharacterized protein (TIGR04255 family)
MDYDNIHLEPDSIKEALCEFRFETSDLAEIVIGRLADSPTWRSFSKTRLASADIPHNLRTIDPAFAFQPTFELRSPEQTGFVIRIGARALSCHFVGGYPGWESVRPVLRQTVVALFEAIPDVLIKRIGFRYLNAFEQQRHKIGHANELNLNVDIGGRDVSNAFLLNYRQSIFQDHICQVTIATPEYVQAPEIFDVLVDIDVFTGSEYSMNDPDPVIKWIDIAHNELKKQFFNILPTNIVKQLQRH